ncbi:MAG: nitroreductase family protein, partial [Acidobacteriota bacterium]
MSLVKAPAASAPGRPETAEASRPAVAQMLRYHRLSSLDPQRPAAAPARFDRASEPVPFRRYPGAATLALPLPKGAAGGAPRAAFDLEGVGELLARSLALVGWRRVANAGFGMRVAPSAGNLHPTECHLLAAGLEPAGPAAALYHYSPFDHALERRREIPEALWRRLGAGGGVLVGLTTLAWRSAWKYGERAFRLCDLDAGHAAAALEASAALVGWRVRWLDLADRDLEDLLGVGGEGPEDERATCLLAVLPAGASAIPRPGGAATREIAELPVDASGPPTPSSVRHREWPGLAEASRAARRRSADRAAAAPQETQEAARPWPPSPWPAGVLRERRSRSIFAEEEIDAERAGRVLAAAGPPRGGVFPWRQGLFTMVLVHRVAGWASGLYLLAEDG